MRKMLRNLSRRHFERCLGKLLLIGAKRLQYKPLECGLYSTNEGNNEHFPSSQSVLLFVRSFLGRRSWIPAAPANPPSLTAAAGVGGRVQRRADRQVLTQSESNM